MTPLKKTPFPTAVQWTHRVLEPYLEARQIVVDATAGNGHDTLFLARKVLPGGHVHAFDVQAQAIESTRKRLEEQVVSSEGYTLHHAGHETLSESLPAELKGRVAVVMFNLGYLPGGDKQNITLEDNTLSALAQALDWLADGGLLTVVVYPGHEGGRQEAARVEQWLAERPSDQFEVQKLCFLNYRATTPYLMAVRKRAWQPRKPVDITESG